MMQLSMRIKTTKTAKLVIGNIPSSRGSDCLARHIDNVQECSGAAVSVETPYNEAEGLAAAAEGARYVDTTAWFCAKTCSAVIGNYDVYYLTHHVSLGYSRFLEGVLTETLDLSRFDK